MQIVIRAYLLQDYLLTVLAVMIAIVDSPDSSKSSLGSSSSLLLALDLHQHHLIAYRTTG